MKEYKITLEGKEFEVKVKDIQPQLVVVEIDGKEYMVGVERKSPVTTEPLEVKPVKSVQSQPKTVMRSSGAGDELTSPLPGVVLDIKVQVGDEVKVGQPVMILEAMKMENEIKADRDGKVEKILVKKGESVLEGTPLMKIGE